MARQIVSAAPGGDNWSLKERPELVGKLHIIEPLSIERDVKTDYGVSDATRANVYVLLSPTESETFEDTLIFQKVLQSQLRKHVGTGSVVVGRPFSDVDHQKRGQSAPWKLAEATEGDLKKATTFLTAQSVKGAQDEPENDGRPAAGAPDEEAAF